MVEPGFGSQRPHLLLSYSRLPKSIPLLFANRETEGRRGAVTCQSSQGPEARSPDFQSSALHGAPLPPRHFLQVGCRDLGSMGVLPAHQLLACPTSGCVPSAQMRSGNPGCCGCVRVTLAICCPCWCPIYSSSPLLFPLPMVPHLFHQLLPTPFPSAQSHCIFLEINRAVFSTGTNDKPGGPHYILRWTSPQVIKETHKPLGDWRYPYMQ